MKPGVSMSIHTGQLFETEHNLPMLCNAIEETKQQAQLRMLVGRK